MQYRISIVFSSKNNGNPKVGFPPLFKDSLVKSIKETLFRNFLNHTAVFPIFETITKLWTSNAVSSLIYGFYFSGFVFLFHTRFKHFGGILEQVVD